MKRKAVWIDCILAALFCGRSANASVIMTLEQVGPNVVATGRGTVDYTDLIGHGGSTGALIDPSNGTLLVGDNTLTRGRLYGVSPFFSFGSGVSHSASSVTGDWFGTIQGCCGRTNQPVSTSGLIAVPGDYVLGMFLSGSAMWNDTTLGELGVTPGIYTLSWGSGSHADSLMLFAGVPVPEPAPALLLFLGAAGLAWLKWRSSIRCPSTRAMGMISSLIHCAAGRPGGF